MGLVKNHLAKIKPYKPGKPIEEVKRELGLKNVIKLASNENALAPSRRVIAAVSSRARSLNRYPDGDSFYLKRALAKRLRVKPANLIIGNGSDEIITFAMRAFLKKDEQVVIAKPTFLMYGLTARVENAAVKYVPLKGYKYDLPGMKKAVTKKTRLIFIANPDNPTGSYADRKEMDNFISGIRNDIIIFLDEAYYEFARGRGGYPESIRYLNKRNVIITRTFSKAYSLAGLRIGYGIAGTKLIEAMNKVRDPFNVNSLAQAAAVAALGDRSFVKRTVNMAAEGRKFICRELELMGVEYIPSVTNFVLIKIKKARKVYKKLLARGIIVREMSAWGLESFLRVTTGTMDENRRFIKALREIL